MRVFIENALAVGTLGMWAITILVAFTLLAIYRCR